MSIEINVYHAMWQEDIPIIKVCSNIKPSQLYISIQLKKALGYQFLFQQYNYNQN